MKNVPVCLIEKNYLVREGFKNLLCDSSYEIIDTKVTFDDYSEPAEAENERKPALIICGFEESENSAEDIVDKMKRRHPSSRVALLSSDPKPELITYFFSEGIDGYISKNLSKESIINALNMIMSGEKVYPAAALEFFMKDDKGRHGKLSYLLSSRELDILKLVADGKTNKEIANHQKIAESTVKAHIKTILRKLNLTNRTQAARRAFSEGLTGNSPVQLIHAVNENGP